MRLRPGWIIQHKTRKNAPKVLVLKYRQGRKRKWFQVEGVLLHSSRGLSKGRFTNCGSCEDVFDVIEKDVNINELLTSTNKLLREVGKLLVSGISYNHIYKTLSS